MGTTRSGRFNDYPGGKGKGGEGGSDDGNGGETLCGKAIGDIDLEEVSTAEYYKTDKDVPPAGSSVNLRERLVGGRLAIETDDGKVVGFLPTQLNYLRQCMGQGYEYVGSITFSTLNPVPSVRIDLGPA